RWRGSRPPRTCSRACGRCWRAARCRGSGWRGRPRWTWSTWGRRWRCSAGLSGTHDVTGSCPGSGTDGFTVGSMEITPNSGTGSGPITPDGSPGEFYTLVPVGGEPGIVAGVVPAGGWVLDLGAGVGRVTHPLVERGYEVVAVDESAEMLAEVRGAETVRSRIQDLRLGRRFDGVLLASHLVHTADEAGRQGL